MKYYAAIAAFFIAAAAFWSDRIERAARAFVVSSPSAPAGANCRATIPKGSSLHQAAMYVIASCGDPPADCRPNIPPEKLQGKTYPEVELRTLIACGTRAELQAFFHRAQDRRDRLIAGAQSGSNASIAQSPLHTFAQIQADLNASSAQSQTNMKLDEIANGVRALGR